MRQPYCLCILICSLVLLISPPVPGQEVVRPPSLRQVKSLDKDWRFHPGDEPKAIHPDFDDSSWQQVDVPHDWSIAGPFGPQYASGTGYAPGGVGWYRKRFSLPQSEQGRLHTVEFDGVYCNAEVWINGHFVTHRPNGYISFEADITPHLHYGKRVNVLAVRVDHSKVADSRWYTGSGIYRHVKLRSTSPARFIQRDTFVSTPKIAVDSMTVRVQSRFAIASEHLSDPEESAPTDRPYHLSVSVADPAGRHLAHRSLSVDSVGESAIDLMLEIEKPELWSIDRPNLYEAVLSVDSGSKAPAIDRINVPFGIRTFRFDPDEGFFLNGKSMKLKGVCVHHDAGGLGAAVPERVWVRRLEILKELGCNAIRTSHNPMAPELLDLCDRMGFLVQNEAFDEFSPPKNKWIHGRNVGAPSRYGYGTIFDKWAVRDLQDFVRRDRNHPCIIMWSIGNEVDYPNDPFSHPVLGNAYRPDHPRAEKMTYYGKLLVDTVRELDPTRPVTAALAHAPMSSAAGFADVLDVVGYNYQEQLYKEHHKLYPERVIYGSENGDRYEHWLAVRDNDYICGQFLWTAFDYLGEAGEWPDRGFESGVAYTTGFFKPIGYWRQALWSDEPMVYLCTRPRGRNGRRGGGWQGGSAGQRESWNYTINEQTEVWCCTNQPDVSLWLNGKEIAKLKEEDERGGWRRISIPFEPGTLKAQAGEGTTVKAQFQLVTAGEPHAVKLIPAPGPYMTQRNRPAELPAWVADGKDTYHVEYQIVDEHGVRVPDANHKVTFNVLGPAKILAIDNGWMRGEEDYQDNKHKAWRGHGLVYLQSGDTAGTAMLSASVPDLKDGTLTLKTKKPD